MTTLHCWSGADGGLHFIMETPFSIEAAAIHAGAQDGYQITRSREWRPRNRVEAWAATAYSNTANLAALVTPRFAISLSTGLPRRS